RDTDCSGANLRNSVWLGVSQAEGFRAEGADWTNATVPREVAGQVGLAVTPVKSHPNAVLFEPERWQEIVQACRTVAGRSGYGEIDAEDLVSHVGLHLLDTPLAINLNETRSVLAYIHGLCVRLLRRISRNRGPEILE